MQPSKQKNQRRDRFAKILSEIRKAKGFSQLAIAREVGVPDHRIADWEHGRALLPDLQMTRRLAKALEISPWPLLDAVDPALPMDWPEASLAEALLLRAIPNGPEWHQDTEMYLMSKTAQFLGALNLPPGIDLVPVLAWVEALLDRVELSMLPPDSILRELVTKGWLEPAVTVYHNPAGRRFSEEEQNQYRTCTGLLPGNPWVTCMTLPKWEAYWKSIDTQRAYTNQQRGTSGFTWRGDVYAGQGSYLPTEAMQRLLADWTTRWPRRLYQIVTPGVDTLIVAATSERTARWIGASEVRWNPRTQSWWAPLPNTERPRCHPQDRTLTCLGIATPGMQGIIMQLSLNPPEPCDTGRKEGNP